MSKTESEQYRNWVVRDRLKVLVIVSVEVSRIYKIDTSIRLLSAKQGWIGQTILQFFTGYSSINIEKTELNKGYIFYSLHLSFVSTNSYFLY